MQTMQSWFGLKDNHNDFTIENDADARLFFARHELNKQLLAILRRSFRTSNPPKLVLYGDWGVGKTHTMRHIEYVVEKQDDFLAKVVFVELPDITSRSTFQVAHSSLLDALSFETAKTWVLQFQTKHPSDAQQVIQEATQSGDVATAFANLLGFGESSRIAWDWLRGISLSAGDARLAGLPPSLSQSNQLVRVLQMFGTLCLEASDQVLVFMLDEATKLDNVSNQDSINHWVNAFKLIADPATKEIGFIVSGSWIDTNDMAPPLNDEQVAGRFGDQNYIRLNNLDEEETAEFISSLVSEWVDEERREVLVQEYGSEADSEQVNRESFPLTWPGLQVAAAYACRNGGFTTPREIQKALDDLLNRAIDDGRHILSSGYVNSLVNA